MSIPSFFTHGIQPNLPIIAFAHLTNLFKQKSWIIRCLCRITDIIQYWIRHSSHRHRIIPMTCINFCWWWWWTMYSFLFNWPRWWRRWLLWNMLLRRIIGSRCWGFVIVSMVIAVIISSSSSSSFRCIVIGCIIILWPSIIPLIVLVASIIVIPLLLIKWWICSWHLHSWSRLWNRYWLRRRWCWYSRSRRRWCWCWICCFRWTSGCGGSSGRMWWWWWGGWLLLLIMIIGCSSSFMPTTTMISIVITSTTATATAMVMIRRPVVVAAATLPVSTRTSWIRSPTWTIVVMAWISTRLVSIIPTLLMSMATVSIVLVSRSFTSWATIERFSAFVVMLACSRRFGCCYITLPCRLWRTGLSFHA